MLDLLERPEPCFGHRGQDRVAVGSLVVPLELDLTHQVRVREPEPLVAPQRSGEPADAALAADAADLDRLGSGRHLGRSYRSLGDVRGNRLQALRAADLELAVALAA